MNIVTYEFFKRWGFKTIFQNKYIIQQRFTIGVLVYIIEVFRSGIKCFISNISYQLINDMSLHTPLKYVNDDILY